MTEDGVVVGTSEATGGPRRSGRVAALCLLFLSTTGSPVAGQDRAVEDREALVSLAGRSPDSVAIELLGRAITPGPGLCPPASRPDEATCVDGVSMQATYHLADRLIDAGDETASLWLRWAARHGRGWPIEARLFRPPVVSAYAEAASAVEGQAEPTEADVETAWTWPSRMDIEADGEVRAEWGGPDEVELSMSIDGGSFGGDVRTLPPGSYSVAIRADGYESVQMIREVLPGVSTNLSVTLAPILGDEAITLARRHAVGVWTRSQSVERCTNGVRVAGRWVITPRRALDEGVGATVTAAEGVFSQVAVVDRIGSEGVLLELPGLDSARVPTTRFAEPREGQWAWAVPENGCGPDEPARTRLVFVDTGAGPTVGPPSLWRMDPGIGAEAVGAPVVDQGGALLGIATAEDRMLAYSHAQDQLDRALIALQETEAQEPQGGGVPWAVVGGAGAAGLLAALLLTRGDDEPGGGSGALVLSIPPN